MKIFEKIKTSIREHKTAFAMSFATSLAIVTPLICSATTGGNSATITDGMLQPLVDGVTANIGVILPVGIGLFALFIGINLIPKLMKKFTQG